MGKHVSHGVWMLRGTVSGLERKGVEGCVLVCVCAHMLEDQGGSVVS